ncbi:MAG: tetratricopeptide repeat protein [Lutibacter sp.]
MKRFIIIISFLIAAVSMAQTANGVAFEQQKMKQALAFGDKTVAANAMYSIILLEGPKSVYKDSLAYLYFNDRNFISCFLVTNDILKNNPGNLDLLEMNAISLESMGATEKAAEAYQNLFTKTNNNYHAYKLAGLQFGLGKFEDAYASIKKSDKLPDDGSVKITFQVNKNYNQNVDLKAAIAYLEGIIATNLSKNAEAKLSFERALKLFPEFVLAKTKLDALNAEKKE